jgi:twinkle protein
MVLAYGCQYIFFDHITAIMDGAGGESNEIAEKAMKGFAQMTRELKFNMQMISHLRKTDSNRRAAEEGGHIKLDDIKGSGAIKQWANNVITLERNQTDEDESNLTKVYLRKARKMGKNVGKYVEVFYDEDTGRLKDYESGFPEKEDFA